MEKQIEVTKISETIWQFNEANEMGPYVDAYLICGRERALVVDSLQTLPQLYAQVRQITDLPLDVVITHGHGDHAGASLKGFVDAGCACYMDMRDFDKLLDFGPKGVEKGWFSDCWDGMEFDLGGYCFEVLSVPGHSLGSLVLLDRKNKLLFSGDTIGSGAFWMQIPTALPLNRFAMGLERLYQETKDLKELLVYPGHRNQSPVQLTQAYVKDVRTITRGLLNGSMKGKPAVLNFHGMHMEYEEISHGTMRSYCYNPKAIHQGAPDSAEEGVKDLFVEKELCWGSVRLRSMFFAPKTEAGEKYPLVVYLHGAGERGDCPRLVLANSGATTFAQARWQEKHPCYILAPQCPEEESWNKEHFQRLLAQTILALPREYPIDSCRVYVTGLSMGGMGTWKLIEQYPQLVAAAMPICGGGNPFTIKQAKDVPVWAFHAEDDEVVPVTGLFVSMKKESVYGTRMMVSALRGAPGRDVRYTEYPAGYMTQTVHAGNHASWIPAYEDEAAKTWLFAQTRYDRYEIQLVSPGLWHIEDFNNDSIYLIEGEDRALVIDTGLGGGDFVGMLKGLTQLPLSLAVTHAHGDHMMHSDKFGKFHMSKKEEAVLPRFLNMMMSQSKTTAADILDIKSGDIINLGGGVEIEVWEVPGHTPGSVVFIDRAHGACFTGDALGVWMQVPGATSLSEYAAGLKAFDQKLGEPGLEKLFFLGGHRRQEGGFFPFGDQYKPNSPERVRDMITLCEQLLGEEADAKPYPFAFDEPAFIAEYGAASMVYKKSILE